MFGNDIVIIARDVYHRTGLNHPLDPSCAGSRIGHVPLGSARLHHLDSIMKYGIDSYLHNFERMAILVLIVPGKLDVVAHAQSGRGADASPAGAARLLGREVGVRSIVHVAVFDAPIWIMPISIAIVRAIEPVFVIRTDYRQIRIIVGRRRRRVDVNAATGGREGGDGKGFAGGELAVQKGRWFAGLLLGVVLRVRVRGEGRFSGRIDRGRGVRFM
mmetsp:Transcript_17535/g.37044  ORF Transcript_17535/g.37044 Transcript_17535/m.37044 type:complete len:216 (+) Transcript_17535:2607-3254(+)